MDQIKSAFDKDRNYIWHAMNRYSPDSKPLIIERADGVFVEDIEGVRYLDAMSGLWCVNSGYGRTEFADAAAEQLSKMAYFPMSQSHMPAIKLAEKLNDWLEGEYIIFFSNSGSEANETAFKIARQYHEQNGQSGRFKVISRYRSYHGNTMGALSATGQAQRKYKYEPLAAGFVHTVPPDCYHCPVNNNPENCNIECAGLLEKTINWEMNETVAAVIMEPYITGGGVLIQQDGYLKKVEKACKKSGALLIMDEVICGFGRTGKKFGFMHEGISPDIITMAKGITSGYLPLAATAVRKDIFDTFKGSEEYDHFRHVNTFGGNPAACALALRNLEVMEDERLIERSKSMGEQLMDIMKEMLSHSNVGDIRQKGLLMGIELVEDKITREPLNAGKVNQIIASCKSFGVLIGKNGDTVAGFNNVLTIAPPLTISTNQLQLLTDVVKKSINEVCKG